MLSVGMTMMMKTKRLTMMMIMKMIVIFDYPALQPVLLHKL